MARRVLQAAVAASAAWGIPGLAISLRSVPRRVVSNENPAAVLAMDGGCPSGGHTPDVRRGMHWAEPQKLASALRRPPPPPQKLPIGWEAVWSPNNSLFYYWNCERSSISWDRPQVNKDMPPRPPPRKPSQTTNTSEDTNCSRAPPPPPPLAGKNVLRVPPPPRGRLPPGWRAVWSKACQAFFYHHNATGAASWLRPGSDKAAALLHPREPSSRPPPPKLPSGWQAIWSEAGRGYYFWHHATGEAVWELPEEIEIEDTQYRPGEEAEMRVERGALRGAWVKCIVTGEGLRMHTYDVFVEDMPPDRQEVFDVPIRSLRKARRRRTGAAARWRRAGNGTENGTENDTRVVPPEHDQAYSITDINLDSQLHVIRGILDALKKFYTSQPPDPYIPGIFDPVAGEIMDVQVQMGPSKGNWIPCRVTGVGRIGGTFNIKFPVNGPALYYLRDVPSWWLRKNSGTEAVIFRHLTAAKRFARFTGR